MVFTYAGDVGIRGLERARVDTGPGVACAHYLFIIQAPVTSRGVTLGTQGHGGVTQQCDVSNNRLNK